MKVLKKETEDYIVLYAVDDKGKELQVPKEQCTLREYREPNEQSIAYWAHYGIDRLTL